MRVPISIKVEPFNIEDYQPRIDATREAFVQYLKEAPRKSSRSKHGLMGPVGKILSEVKSGRHDPYSLKGYAIRVHEAGNKQPTQTSLKALELGVDHLVSLLAATPVTVHDQILDRLDYGLYYNLRKEVLEAREARRREWIYFIRNKYKTEAALSEAWGDETVNFDELYLPRKTEGDKGKKATVKQQDIAAFWESQGSIVFVSDDEEVE